jgi:hypothetical protein
MLHDFKLPLVNVMTGRELVASVPVSHTGKRCRKADEGYSTDSVALGLQINRKAA